MSVSRPQRGFPIRYLLVFWLFVLSAVAFLDRTNVSIAGLQIAHEYGINNVRLGLVVSAFLIGYTLFQIPGGWFAGRIGPRRVLTFGVVWWGLFTALTALVPPKMHGALLTLMMVRFALGAGEAVVYPASNQFVARWIPTAERGKANGLIFAGVGAGSGLTPMLLTWIITHYGWRASFWFSAVIGILVGGAWYLIARDRPEEHGAVSEQELAHIIAGRGATLKDAGPELAAEAREGVPWLRVFTSREVISLTLSYFSFGYVAWIFFSWFYIYLAQVRGLNLKTSAVYTMFPFIAMTLCSLLGGLASDWISRHVSVRLGRCGMGVLSLGLTAMFLILGSRAQHALAASLFLAGGAGALYLSQSCFWSITADFAGRHSGVVSSIMNMGAQAGGAVTASLTPYIALRFGWNAAFLTAAALAVAGALAWLLIDPSKRLGPSRRFNVAASE